MLNAARDLGRAHDIASVLIRYGFGGFVRGLGMGKALERAGRVLHWQHVEDYVVLDTPQRVRRVLEDLGPTFIKLGQIMATRVDLFPPQYIAEFEKLQDQAPPVPFEELLAQLEEDLGGGIDEIFLEVETQRLNVLRQLFGGYLERHEDAWFIELDCAPNEKFDRQESLATSGAAAYQRGSPRGQSTLSDLVQPQNSGGNLRQI